MEEKASMAAEVGNQELDRIDDFLEANFDDKARAAILPTIQSYRLHLDESQKRVIIKLQRPIEFGDSEICELKIGYITPYEVAEIENKFSAKAMGNGNAEMPLGYMKSKIFRLVSKATGQPLGVVQRIGRYDFNDLQNLLGFLV